MSTKRIAVCFEVEVDADLLQKLHPEETVLYKMAAAAIIEAVNLPKSLSGIIAMTNILPPDPDTPWEWYAENVT